jgi:hypothetical protein
MSAPADNKSVAKLFEFKDKKLLLEHSIRDDQEAFDAFIELDAAGKKVHDALQLQPDLKALREHEEKMYQHDIKYAQEIAIYMHKHFYASESPLFIVLESMSGVLSQIDNMVEGMASNLRGETT